MTHTYALLEVLPSTWADIRKRLERAGCDHAFHDNAIDMHGLALITMNPPSEERESIFNKIDQGHYKATADEDRESAIKRFKKDALQRVGLDSHPNAEKILEFCDTQVGTFDQYARLLEQIASFMQ